jgi:eukaryotic-like serine/threonine-protein kinase
MATAPPPPDPTAAVLAGTVIGGCRLERLLGVGGMGAVWRAHHLALDVPVAVKLMLPIQNLDPNAAERLLREARAAARLRHPNIVGVLNVGDEGGLRFLVMELIEGQSLQQLLDQRGAWPVAEAVALVLQILDALTLTFEHRFVHRDLKPDNILIDPRGVAKLADLGLAKQTDSDLDLTRTGVVMGSPYYLAPEQAINTKAVDPRADLYALGCVLHHLLTGVPPYRGDNPMEVIVQHVSGPLPDLASLPNLPRGLAAVVLRMLAKRPSERYQTPAEVRAALAPFAAPAERPAPPARPSRARRTLLALSALALLALLALVLLRARPAAPPAPDSRTATATATEVTPGRAAEPPPRPRRRLDVNRARPPAEAARPGPEATPGRGRGPLAEALAARDTQRLRQLLDRGTPPNVGDGATSPLHQSVAMGEPQIVRMLLEKGANPNARDPAGETPLHQALRRGDRGSAAALLDFGANPNLRDRFGRTPLDLAAGDPYLVQKLLEKGAH